MGDPVDPREEARAPVPLLLALLMSTTATLSCSGRVSQYCRHVGFDMCHEKPYLFSGPRAD